MGTPEETEPSKSKSVLKADTEDESQDFSKIRDECLAKGTLWEDPKFPAEDSSIFFSKGAQKAFQWQRPKEIVKDPKLFVDGASRFDVQQGELGDDWLLAAVANLTLYPNLLRKVVPDNQSFVEKYAGIFHFSFWRFGHWIDVMVDDRLPTFDGKLVFLHSSTLNEFWCALLEKAYAKVHGSYEALTGGTAGDAMEDFTGGLTESYELKEAPRNLFNIMLRAYQGSSLMGCSIEADPKVVKKQTPEGLIKGHTYCISKVQYLNSKTKGKIPLIRLCNPWGEKVEWNGPWSDKSPEWTSISEDERKQIGLTFDADGEFWMSYKDFRKKFSHLELCNLHPDSLPDEESHDIKKWETSLFEGKWVKGITAGGCLNYLDTFWHNPQFRITLENPDEDNDEHEDKNKCTVIVALMQKDRRTQIRVFLYIGFAIYHLKDPESLPKPLNQKFFKNNVSVGVSPSFTNTREVSCRFKLPPGVYCIVPSTFEPNEEGEFLIRVFSEHKTNMKEHDEVIGLGEVDKRVVITVPEEKTDDEVKEFFKKVAGEDMEIDWVQLKEILDYAMRPEVSGSTANQNSSMANTLLSLMSVKVHHDSSLALASDPRNAGFSKHACRSMIALMDVDKSGKIGFDDFEVLWKDIVQWKAAFRLYDEEEKGYLNAFELRQALDSAGFKLNTSTLQKLNHRYGTREGIITFDDYMKCVIRLRAMFDAFHEREEEGTNKATFTFEEWIDKTIYS